MNEDAGSGVYDPPPWRPAGRPRRSRLWILIAFLTVAVAAGVGIWLYQEKEEKEWLEAYRKTQKGLAPSGGKFFAKTVLIPIPRFLQDDPRWGANLLGPSATETLGSHGCAVSSAAMVLASYGMNIDPQRLNDFLNGNNGFTPQAWIEWKVAVQLDPERVRFVYEDLPSYELIDANLMVGNPVIIRLGYPPPRTTSHFVVICGKKGFDYLIMDPGSHGKEGPYPLAETGARIDALRYYEAVKKG